MPSFEETGRHELLKRVYNASTPEESREAYDEWASTYDEDLAEQDYQAPALIAKTVAALTADLSTSLILDAGCGTGLSGIALSQVGAKQIDGIDLSEGMLNVASNTKVYRNLWPADLSKPIEKLDGSYDIVTCVGTLTHGHVRPSPALPDFVRITRAGGFVAVTILDDVFESGGYKAEVERLANESLVEIVSAEKKRIGGRNDTDIMSRIVVLRKPKSV